MRKLALAGLFLHAIITYAQNAPTFSLAIAPLHPALNITHTAFYNPFGAQLISAGSDEYLWDGDSLQLKNGGPRQVNARGDGFANYVSGWTIEYELFAAHIYIRGTGYTLQRHEQASTFALAINSNSEVVGRAGGLGGTEAFLWSNGQVSYLGDLINGRSPIIPEYGVAISDEGIIYGTRHLPSGAKGFITLTPDGTGRYNASEISGFPSQSLRVSRKGHVASAAAFWDGTKMTTMGNLGEPGRVYPQRVNALGQVAGMAQPKGDTGYHGFFWAGDIMYDLNTLVSLPNGWVIAEATDINDYGQIAARAYGDRRHQAICLTPDPRIASIARKPRHVSLTIHPGSSQPISVRASTDCVNWQEVARLDQPEYTSSISLPISRTHQFFRIERLVP